MNGSTKWLRVRVPATVQEGWVSARYVSPKLVEPAPSTPTDAPVVFHVAGKMSTFGGPEDEGMSATEGLAIFETIEEAEANNAGDFFLSADEAGAIGLGRRLRVEKLYVACRWNYHEISRHFLQDAVAHVSANGRTVTARPMDWGPNENTGRVCDMSPAGADALELSTDDICSVTVYASGK